MFKIIRVPGYSCPDKYLLIKDDKPIIFANGRKRLSLCIQFLEGYEVDLKDKKIERLLMKIREEL